MDTGDIEGVVATFTPDGVVKDVTGKRWDAAAGGLRGFASHFLTRPNRRGGQHHVQHLFVEPADGGGYRVISYWVSIQWDAEGDRKFIRAMGSYETPASRWMANGSSRKRSLTPGTAPPLPWSVTYCRPFLLSAQNSGSTDVPGRRGSSPPP